MKRERLSCHFRRSGAAGLAYELVNYGFFLLCGWLLSGLLERTMAGAWQEIGGKAALTAAALAAAVLPRFALARLRSDRKLADIQRFREFLYHGVLERTVCVDDRGEMDVRLNGDVHTIAGYFQDACPKAAGGTVVMICSTALLCGVDLRVGVLFFALALTQLLPVLLYEKWARKNYEQTHSDEEDYCNWLMEGYGGIRTIKAYGAEEWYMARFFKLNRAVIRSGSRTEGVAAVENIVYAAVDSLLHYGSYVILGLFVLFWGLPVEKTPLLIVLAGYLFSSVSPVFDLRMQRFECEEACKRLGIREERSDETAGETVLFAQNVEKMFGGKRILAGASCTVRAGERVLLTGENGSGKSTLLRILAGVEEADGGAVAFGIPEGERAFCLQEEPELTLSGWELAKAMEAAGSVEPARLERHFRGMGIAELLKKPLNQLSLGERKKFYLAAALARASKLLVLDEPTNHVDKESVDYLEQQLRAFDGALLVCTHGDAVKLPWDRVIRMEGGVCHEE